METDIKRIEEWAQIFKHPKELIETIVPNAIKNHAQIQKLVIHIEKEWTWDNPEDYMYAGVDASTILILTVGKVPLVEDPDNLKVTQWGTY